MIKWNRCDRKFGPLIAQRQAGALSSAEASALGAHLERCNGCRVWERELRESVEWLKSANEIAPLDHPSPEKLAALAEAPDRLGVEERTRIESHLEACSECKAEWNVATRWSPVALPSSAPSAEPRAAPFGNWGWFAAGALSTAAAAAVLFVVVFPPAVTGPELRPTLQPAGVPVQIRGAHHRATADATALSILSDDQALVISLTVEALPGSPLVLELIDADGRSVLASTEVVLRDPSGLLLFSVSPAELPGAEGEFRVTVAGTEERFRYPFRVERDSD